MQKGEVYSLTEHMISPMKYPAAFLGKACGWIKDHVHANEKVGLAVSGGIDSTVVARILRDSIGENLYLTHMDHGFMRLINGREESEIVDEMFSDYPNFTYVIDRERFYKAVEGIKDGNRKRAAFREAYKSILEKTMEPHGCIWTADGTIKPDIVETRGGIKLQHNVDLGFAQKKIEPLASLSKQEVRVVAKYLGIPHLRQPFPGPGLLVRTVGIYSPEKLATEKKANDIVEQEYRRFMLSRYGREMVIDGETGLQIPFQTFAATFDLKDSVLAAKVTGLVDDGKRYERIYREPLIIPDGSYLKHVEEALEIAKKNNSHRILCRLDGKNSGRFAVAIRAIDSIDVKTCVPNLSGSVPEKATARILKEIPEVGAVFFDITPKPPGTVEYE